MFVRVLGRVPSPDELKIFSDDKSSTRREKLVERLLSGSEYGGTMPNWAAIWTTALIGRSGGRAGSLASHREFEKYLQSATVRR